MKDFLVSVPCEGCHGFVVRAENEEDAIEQVALGEVDLSHDNVDLDTDTNNWEVQDYATP